MPSDHSGLAARLGRLTAVLLAVFALYPSGRPCLAQDALEDIYDGSKHYLLTLSGQVGVKRFQSVKAMLILAPSPPGATYDYVVTINGWPKTNGANTFVWNSQDSLLESLSGRVTCRIVNSFSQSPNIHFFYLSPILLKQKGMVTQREGEDVRQAMKEALPTKIQARAGELILNFNGDQVAGRVWLSGYDFIQKADVRYQATFQGGLSRELKSTLRGGQFN